jgi:hypothetical protein
MDTIKTPKHDVESLANLLSGKFDLRQKFEAGRQSYYRLWQTIEIFDLYGDVVFRNQWRGDFRRTMETIRPSGKIEESVTWHSVGVRNWIFDESKYDQHHELEWARDFSYSFSIEDDYRDLNWDYSIVPKTLIGSTFRQAFQVSAHFEFDFLRSVSHAAIDRLQKVGDIVMNPPEEGQTFSLSFPPVVTNSVLRRKHVHIGFLGITQIGGVPCALLYYRQGPQTFSWDAIEDPNGDTSGDPDKVWHKDLKSWQQGHLCIRLQDGGLAEGEFSENHMIKKARPGGGDPTADHSRGIWSIREITPEAYTNGLQDWGQDQLELPWHCLFQEFRQKV